ncbi:hypothetical protein OUZ56_000441 [Daphnia magna]|uniref:Uncharacterized protein n=1 Tax=Daphnia magna TaxID=35525 RepID=A0ABQ9ZZT9_9CRUS|nr:hypothetical protein OUZ56_000441 [Daphnia magna]
MTSMERHQPNSASFSIAGGGWGPRASVDHHLYQRIEREREREGRREEGDDVITVYCHQVPIHQLYVPLSY